MPQKGPYPGIQPPHHVLSGKLNRSELLQSLFAGIFSNPPTIFVILFCALFSFSTSFLKRGPQKRTLFSRKGLTAQSSKNLPGPGASDAAGAICSLQLRFAAASSFARPRGLPSNPVGQLGIHHGGTESLPPLKGASHPLTPLSSSSFTPPPIFASPANFISSDFIWT